MYEAIVCKLRNVRPHSNASRLKLATVQGHQIIVGLYNCNEELGVFFDADGVIMPEHLSKCNLYSHSELNEDKTKKGYFGKNGRVRVQKLRGEESDGFWQPIEAFNIYGKFPYKEGDTFQEINGTKICEKYNTPATIKAMNKLKQAQKNRKLTTKEKVKKFFQTEDIGKVDTSMLLRHYDTGQLRTNLGRIQEGSVVYISEKCHGTSGRTGRVRVVHKYSPWMNFLFRLGIKEKPNEWEYMSGSRKVNIVPHSEFKGYYDNSNFRTEINDNIKEIGLKKGEIIFYEICGFLDNGKSIMPSVGIDDKELKKIYGDTMLYKYNCGVGKYRFLVYRIAMVNEDNQLTEYSWPQVERRCEELGLETVPVLRGPIIVQNTDQLLDEVRTLSDGPSTLDKSHVREGVVVRVEHKDVFTCFKWKGFSFCSLEGIMKNDINFIDPEEVE